MKPSIIATWAMLVAAGVGCHESDLGTGVNTVERDYAKPAAQVWAAAVKGAESQDLRILSDPHDHMGGDLVAERGNGSPVRIQVRSLDEKTTHVSVRVEPGDRDLAKILQERIATGVGLGEAKAGLFGGNSVDGTYPSDLNSCLHSARRAFLALKVTPTDEESHATWTRISGRLPDSTPVSIRIEKEDEVSTRVTFIAGNVKNEDNRAFAQRMKDEFEASTRPGGS